MARQISRPRPFKLHLCGGHLRKVCSRKSHRLNYLIVVDIIQNIRNETQNSNLDDERF